MNKKRYKIEMKKEIEKKRWSKRYRKIEIEKNAIETVKQSTIARGGKIEKTKCRVTEKEKYRATEIEKYRAIGKV